MYSNDNSSRWSEQQLARRIHYVRSHWHVTNAKCYAEPFQSFQSFPISISPWHTTTMLCKSCYHSRNEHNSLARRGTCCSKLQNSKGCSNRCCCRCHGPLAQMQWPRQESNGASVTGCIVIVILCYPWMTKCIKIIKIIKTPPGTDMQQIAWNCMCVAKSGLRMWRLHIHAMSWMDGKRVGVGIIWCCSPSSARAQTLDAVSPSLGSCRNSWDCCSRRRLPMTRWVEGEFMKVNAWTFNKSVCSCGRQGWMAAELLVSVTMPGSWCGVWAKKSALRHTSHVLVTLLQPPRLPTGGRS